MRAIYAARVGGDNPLDNLEVGEQPDPALPAGWARVRVETVSLNHHDLWTLRGVSARPVTPPQILGCDAVGRVESLGEGAADGVPRPGTRVVLHSVITCGACAGCVAGDPLLCRSQGILSDPPYAGALADLVAVPAANLIPLPDSVSSEAAACLPTAYLTAYRMLFDRAGLRPGMSVLIQGASGGVATAAILLAHGAGITVHATSRDPAKRAAAVVLGASSAFAPDDREAAKTLMRSTGGGVDAVMETVGEPTWELSLRSVRPGGTVVVAGATAGANPPAQLNRIFWRHITISGTSMGTRAELERLVGMCAAGGLEPLVGSVTAFDAAPTAFAELAAGDQHGKLVIRVS